MELTLFQKFILIAAAVTSLSALAEPPRSWAAELAESLAAELRLSRSRRSESEATNMALTDTGLDIPPAERSDPDFHRFHVLRERYLQEESESPRQRADRFARWRTVQRAAVERELLASFRQYLIHITSDPNYYQFWAANEKLTPWEARNLTFRLKSWTGSTRGNTVVDLCYDFATTDPKFYGMQLVWASDYTGEGHVSSIPRYLPDRGTSVPTEQAALREYHYELGRVLNCLDLATSPADLQNRLNQEAARVRQDRRTRTAVNLPRPLDISARPPSPTIPFFRPRHPMNTSREEVARRRRMRVYRVTIVDREIAQRPRHYDLASESQIASGARQVSELDSHSIELRVETVSGQIPDSGHLHVPLPEGYALCELRVSVDGGEARLGTDFQLWRHPSNGTYFIRVLRNATRPHTLAFGFYRRPTVLQISREAAEFLGAFPVDRTRDEATLLERHKIRVLGERLRRMAQGGTVRFQDLVEAIRASGLYSYHRPELISHEARTATDPYVYLSRFLEPGGRYALQCNGFDHMGQVVVLRLAGEGSKLTAASRPCLLSDGEYLTQGDYHVRTDFFWDRVLVAVVDFTSSEEDPRTAAVPAVVDDRPLAVEASPRLLTLEGDQRQTLLERLRTARQQLESDEEFRAVRRRRQGRVNYHDPAERSLRAVIVLIDLLEGRCTLEQARRRLRVVYQMYRQQGSGGLEALSHDYRTAEELLFFLSRVARYEADRLKGVLERQRGQLRSTPHLGNSVFAQSVLGVLDEMSHCAGDVAGDPASPGFCRFTMRLIVR